VQQGQAYPTFWIISFDFESFPVILVCITRTDDCAIQLVISISVQFVLMLRGTVGYVPPVTSSGA
jgi:hypothetical protein